MCSIKQIWYCIFGISLTQRSKYVPFYNFILVRKKIFNLIICSARIVAPYFTIPPEPLYEVMPGDNVNLTCVAAGSPIPFVSWKKGSIELNDKESQIPIGKNVLTLTDVQESDNYTCIANSKFGTQEKVSQVIVRSLPRAPSNVMISDVTPTSIRISWSYDLVPESFIQFSIQYKPKSSSQFKEINGITTLFYIINSLSPYTEYEFYVIATNSIGRGQPSSVAYVTTGETSKYSSWLSI